MDLICMGEMLIDFIPGEGPLTFLQNPGGAPANVAVAAARSGLKSGMITKVGDDDFGHFLFGVLEREGVEVLSPEMTQEAVTTLAFVTLSESGERSFVFGRKPGADMLLTDKDVKREDLEATTMLHTGSFGLSSDPARTTTIRAIEAAHDLGKLVSFDINYRNVVWNDDKEACAEEVRELLPHIDLLKVSDEEVDMLGGEEAIPQLMRDNDVTLIALTRGSKGVDCYLRGEMNSYAGFAAPKVVDTTGAGDAFWGAFLAKLLMEGVKKAEDLTPEVIAKAARYGNASGSICVQSKGAISSLPTKAEIEAFLDAQ